MVRLFKTLTKIVYFCNVCVSHWKCNKVFAREGTLKDKRPNRKRVTGSFRSSKTLISVHGIRNTGTVLTVKKTRKNAKNRILTIERVLYTCGCDLTRKMCSEFADKPRPTDKRVLLRVIRFKGACTFRMNVHPPPSAHVVRRVIDA